MRSVFEFNEKHLSQIPALQVLINLGYTYLMPTQVGKERGENPGSVLLEDILRRQLKRVNRICHKGGEYLFSEENIQSAIQKLKSIPYDGLQNTSAVIYDMLTLGTTLEQTIDGDSRNFPLRYIDWQNPSANVFHATVEFRVRRSRSARIIRPDIVLFVNGIPLVSIECKAPNVEVQQAISQTIRNQGNEYIPRFFAYMQILVAVNKNDAWYATVGTPKEFWSVWKEQGKTLEHDIHCCVNKVLSEDEKDALFSGEFASPRPHFDGLERNGARVVTAQDRSLYNLCRPRRLLEIIHRFTIFERGEKKIARHQQFFLVRSAVHRIKQRDGEGRRKGGIVWHTQGSGKSITMTMLARVLAMDLELGNPRIVLVTDRKDLDKQLGNTFTACGLDRARATSGRNLVTHLKNKVGIITTLINKFEKALFAENPIDDSSDIIVLVDESHRTNFGTMAARMRKVLPKACYIGFTGTPLFKEDKRNSFARFGPLIEPHYTTRQAIADQTVVPLLYEGRDVEMRQEEQAIDKWFARHSEDLTDKQKLDLKRKYSRARELNKAARVVYMRAFDIGRHFQTNWRGTGFKAQLIAPDKATALKYHAALKETSMISSAVVLSAPDPRPGHEEVGTDPSGEVAKFWKRMMARYGGEEVYVQSIIDRFKESDRPEILIVVDKLITGFDAPRNTVLYLCRPLRGHTLLQAIARVNRVCEGKEFGYIIDYANVLGELDKALNDYDALSGFAGVDLAGVLRSVRELVSELPQCHSDLWDIFKEVKHSRDEECYEKLLADDTLRGDFQERLSRYSKTLAIALSCEEFIMRVDEARLTRYKDDCKRFQKLRVAVGLRYAENVDYRDYGPKIKKLLDTHIQSDDVTHPHAPVNIFDSLAFNMVKEGRGVYENKTEAARADAIAHKIKRTIIENMAEDPAFYKAFSELIQETIDAFRERRISGSEYLRQVSALRDRFVGNERDDVPSELRGNADASAYFGVIKPCLEECGVGESEIDSISAQIALAVQNAMKAHWKVDFWRASDAQNKVKLAIDDFLHDRVKKAHNIDLAGAQMDKIIDQTMRIARSRRRA